MLTPTYFSGRMGAVTAGWSLVLSLLVTATIAAAPATGWAGEPERPRGPLPETPAEYTRLALERSSQLRGLYRRWKAQLKEADAAGAGWPQPMVGYRTFIDAFWLDDPGLRHRVMVSQRFPWPGVLEQAAQPHRYRAEAVQHRFQANALQVAFEVRSLLVDIARIDALREILRQQSQVYADVAKIVEGTMGADQADYGDLLRVNTTREQVEDRLDVLDSRREQRIARLRRQLELPAETDLTFDFSGDNALLDVPEQAPERGDLVEKARKNHPSLAARRAEAEAHRARAAYADKKKYPWPKLTLGVDSIPNRMGAGDFDRRTALMLDISVPVPLFLTQFDAEEAAFEHRREAALAERERTLADLRGRIDESVTRIEEKVRRLERYRKELLPLAGDATEQMLQQVETGERDITDYLLSVEQELDLETNVVEFKAAIATERARLEQLTGGAFQAEPAIETPEIDIRDARKSREDDE